MAMSGLTIKSISVNTIRGKMRILGVSKKWPKLKQPYFTTFRFKRKDKDWEVKEVVQIVYKPRRKGGGEKLGVARINSKESRWVMNSAVPIEEGLTVNYLEATSDGFSDVESMVSWVSHAYQARNFKEPMNKLTLRWVNYES